MIAPRRWFRFSLRTLFVVVTAVAVVAFQASRADGLRKRAATHELQALSVLTENMHGGILPNDDKAAEEQMQRWKIREAYGKAMSDYHMALANKCQRAIWQPWVELWPCPLAPPEPAATTVHRP